MKTAFLDLDGTLLDSAKRHGVVLNDSLLELGFKPIDTDDFVNYKSDGFTTKDYLVKKNGFSNEDAAQISKHWVEHIEDDNYLALDTWFSDAVDFVSGLCKKGYKCIIITSRQKEGAVRKQISTFKEIDRISETIVVLPKTGSKSMYMSDKVTDGSVMIGDTEVDFDAGKECGIKTYILNRGFRSKSFWDQKGIKSYKDLDEIIKDL